MISNARENETIREKAKWDKNPKNMTELKQIRGASRDEENADMPSSSASLTKNHIRFPQKMRQVTSK